MCVTYLLIVHHLEPAIEGMENVLFWKTLIRLILPFLACDLLCFLIVFETVCNVCAELTRLKDRRFYLDWWNWSGILLILYAEKAHIVLVVRRSTSLHGSGIVQSTSSYSSTSIKRLLDSALGVTPLQF